MSKTTVILIIIGLFLGILGWDYYLYKDSIEGNTITQIIQALSEESKFMPFGVGLLFGYLTCHFFER